MSKLRFAVSLLAGALFANALGNIQAMSAAERPEPLSFRDRDYLEGAGAERTLAAIKHMSGLADYGALAFATERRKFELFPGLSALISEIPANELLAAVDADAASASPVLSRIEIIDRSLVERVRLILAATGRILAQQGTMFAFGAVNISLGVPKALLGQNRSAEGLIGDALASIVGADIPVVISIGNDGPVEGTANPWASAPGVIVATATDGAGEVYWQGSSRFRPGEEHGRNLFAAHGYLSVGAYAVGTVKTPAMLEAERMVDLTAIVGAGNERFYRVDSGTSYAATTITRRICILHQALMAVRFMASGTDAMTGNLPPYIRAYMDTGVDETHPQFHMRRADQRFKYGGQQFEIQPGRRDRITRLILSGVVLDLRYRPSYVLAMLRRAAQPVPGTRPHETGSGFVSVYLIWEAVKTLRATDLVDLFANPADPRIDAWRRLAQQDPDPLFTPEEVTRFHSYCEQADLSLMLKVQ